MFAIDRSSAVPLTDQIEARLRGLIAGAQLAAGVKLLSIRQLAAQLGVSPNTVITAYDRLVAAGLIDSRGTAGFFVCERERQLAGTMSGGEQQMVAIARAMMSAPRLLLLDEPSLGLAPRMVDEMLAIARRIADAGTTVLMAEQNVRKALAVADQGHVMERGGFVAGGPAKQLAQSSVIREAYLGVPTSGSG
ncbi:MAG: GntR family transcriptional regulator [Betaproteobacteria bacterium]|nr:MAG: GntR family transcriptional regulator [Betaproteobacteria bacterium]